MEAARSARRRSSATASRVTAAGERRADAMAGSATRPSSADPHGPVDEEDHQGDGAGRDEPHRQGPGSGWRRRCRTPTAITGVLTALASQRDDRPPAADASRQDPQRAGGPGDHQRPRPGRRATTSNALRTANELIARLREEGKELVLYVVGRKGVGLLPVPQPARCAASWTGFSEQPTFADAREVGETLIDAFVAGADDDGGERRRARTASSAWTSCTSSTPSSARC